MNFDLQLPSLTVRRLVVCGVLSALMVSSLAGVAQSETRYRRVFDARTQQYYYVPEQTLKSKTTNFVKNPVVKQSAIGAAVGAAAGGLSERSTAVKGAGVGAVVGAGTGLIDSSRALDGKPMVRSALKGAAIGTGTSAIIDKSMWKGAAAGAAAGAGVHLLRKTLQDNRNDD
jgi:hypothetical protein